MTTEVEQVPVSKVIEQLEAFILLIQNSAVKFDPRYILKVFRELKSIRRDIKANDLIILISYVYPSKCPTAEYILEILKPFSTGSLVILNNKSIESMILDDPKFEILPEIDLFIHLLVQIFLHDLGETKVLHEFNGKVIQKLKSYNKRTLDYIQAKVWYYIFRSSELANDLINIRVELMNALRTATLRHDTETRASVTTLLLRDYILTNDINQAYNLVEKTEFPNEATTSVVARYYYYLARIQTIQLDYSSANECVITAIRKCPQTKNALGFLQSATKLKILIELLTGEIPELSSFDDKLLSRSLRPYSEVTKAVRLGDLTIFNNAIETFGASLKKDNNYNLVLRLRQNVIKAGIRIISLSYKRISLKDICIKLHLESELTAEYIVAKAIKDGVVDATINHSKGYMETDEISDVYSTTNPQDEFDRRIKFCMQLHNDSVKAMRYPMNEDRRDVDADTQARERAEAPKQTESPRANREELPKMSLKQYQLIRSYMREKEETYNRRTTINYSLSMMMIFLALTYASVPIYRAICQRTGWGGTPITDKNRFTRDKLSPVSTERKLRVSFTAETSGALPWKFVPQQREVWLVPGETALAFYKAKNVGDRDITGMATYSVTPDHVAPYFNKIQCFCFEEQRLQKGEEVDMPLFFFIDPEFSRDPAMRNIDDVVLHYTFFRAKHDQQHETLFGNADSKNEETTAAHST
ncbi:26S proteasome non-ATPase regulatory subunit [Pichia californica]|nr:26S proteasome non-ATPase regulatory subunit [[Candida] californica]